MLNIVVSDLTSLIILKMCFVRPLKYNVASL